MSFVKQKKGKSFLAFLVWGCASLFYLYELILRVSPSVMTHGLMDQFDISAGSFGFLASFYYFAYVPLQIPCGIFVDKWGSRIVITLSCFLCTLGAWMFAGSESLMVAKLARFLIGAGSACAFISCLKLASGWFSPKKFALMAGLTNMLGTLGGTLGGPPVAIMVNNFGWSSTTYYMSYVGVVLTLLCWFIIRNEPKEKIEKNSQRVFNKTSFIKSLKDLIKDKQVVLAGFIGGLMYLPISVFAELWGVPFFMKNFNVDNTVASKVSVMIFLGMALGSPVMAKWANHLKSIIKVMSYNALIASLLFILLIYFKNNYIYLAFAFCFLIGFAIGGQVLCFSLVKNRVNNKISGTSMAFTNTIVMLTAMIFQPTLGMLLDLGWNGELDLDGVRVYSLEVYRWAISTLPLCLIISWLTLKFCKEDKFEEL